MKTLATATNEWRDLAGVIPQRNELDAIVVMASTEPYDTLRNTLDTASVLDLTDDFVLGSFQATTRFKPVDAYCDIVVDIAPHRTYLSLSRDLDVWGGSHQCQVFWKASTDLLPEATPRAPVTPRWFSYVNESLDELLDFPEEDHPDAYPKPPSATIERARKLAVELFRPETPTPSVVPSEEGGVDFVWHKGNCDFQISIGASSVNVWKYDWRTSESWFGLLEEHFSDVSRHLDYLDSLSAGSDVASLQR